MEEIFVNHATDRTLIFRLYKVHKKLKTKIKNSVNKFGKSHEQISKDKIQMINRYMKKCSGFLGNRVMQTEVTVRFYLTPKSISALEDTEKKVSHCWWECKPAQPLWKTL